jgi:hypothetical protein
MKNIMYKTTTTTHTHTYQKHLNDYLFQKEQHLLDVTGQQECLLLHGIVNQIVQYLLSTPYLSHPF